MCELHMSYMSGLSEEVKRKTAVICQNLKMNILGCFKVTAWWLVLVSVLEI